MTIRPGCTVRLDAHRTTSVRGGVYDISGLAEADRKRILATRGVSAVRNTQASAAAKEEE
ncbi:MAG: hypothetical protein M0R75_01470 [Dehalococcoidia bacterium]|nr:hypothetical protein [Dehalococcoidia bacterium]